MRHPLRSGTLGHGTDNIKRWLCLTLRSAALCKRKSIKLCCLCRWQIKQQETFKKQYPCTHPFAPLASTPTLHQQFATNITRRTGRWQLNAAMLSRPADLSALVTLSKNKPEVGCLFDGSAHVSDREARLGMVSCVMKISLC